jgi:hypothetical protein
MKPPAARSNFGSAALETINGKRWFEVVYWFGGFIALFAWTYSLGLHLGWSSADILRGLLQGADMAHGNILLKHWYSGEDSYWALDSVFFALGVLVIGTKLVLAHVVAAFVWTSVIIASCVVAKTGLPRKSSVVSTATIVLVLALPSALLARFLSASDDHVSTVLVSLVAFFGLRNGRVGLGWIIAVLLFALGLLSDPLIVAYALVPALMVGVLDSARSRKWSSGIATFCAPLAALALAFVIRKIAEGFGTYQLSPGTQIVPPSARITNLHALVPDTLSLLGFGSAFSANRIPWELGVFRILGVVILGAGILVGLACLLLGLVTGKPRIDVQGMTTRSRASFRLNDLLLLGVIGDVITYVAFRDDATGLRYLTAGIVFSAILGAMLLGQLASLIHTPRARHVGVALATIVLCANAACAGVFLSRSEPVSPFPRLAAFLLRHDLVRGVGDYWSSAPMTLYSGDKVVVRQVLPTFQGGIGPYLWIVKGTWYSGTFQFLIYDVRQYEGDLIRFAPRFPFAAVAHTYSEGPFRIVVWRTPHTMRYLAGE